MDFLSKPSWLLFVVLVAGAWFSPGAWAQTSSFSLEAVGSRCGFSTGSHTRDFNQAEGFMVWNLPLTWDPCTKWHLRTAIDMAAGWLSGRGDDAFIGSGVPLLLVKRDYLPVTLDFGSGLSVLSREQFGSRDFGTLVQFSSHAGLNFDFGKHLSLGYRFQHMSNGHLSNYNPGLNLHMIAVNYRF